MRRYVGPALLALAVLAGCSTADSAPPAPPSTPQPPPSATASSTPPTSATAAPFDLVGLISLVDPGGYGPGPGGVGCEGTGGYSDLTPGATVTVQDADGTIVAVGSVSVGAEDAGRCQLFFEVTDVPASDFYQVEVSGRGAVPFTDEQARGGEVLLTIG